MTDQLETYVSQAESIRMLAKAHGMTEERMTRLWRAAHRSPPEDRPRIERYRASKLIDVLLAAAERCQAQLLAEAEAEAFRTTHFRLLAETQPSTEELVGLIKHPVLRRFAEHYDPRRMGGALILGESGLGKSLAAFCVMRRMIRMEALAADDAWQATPFDGRPEIPPKRSTWASFDAPQLGEVQQRTPLGDPPAREIVAAQEAKYLIIEDLGLEEPFHLKTITSIALVRYRMGYDSIVTSGIPHKTLQKSHGDAVLRRFYEVGGRGTVVDLWELEGKKKA